MTQKSIFLTLFLGIIGFPIYAQYDISDPNFSQRETIEFSVQGIRIYPEKIRLNFKWSNKQKSRTVRASNQTRFKIIGFSNDEYPITDRFNINAESAPIPDREDFFFSLTFNVSLFNLLEKHLNGNELSREFFLEGAMFIDYYDCTDAFRVERNITYGNCWNIYGIKATLPLTRWNAIYSYGKMEAQLKKDEFETTEQYKKRISPDGLQIVFDESVDIFTEICERAYELELIRLKPEITYNADEQLFTLTYPGAVPVKIKMTLDKARDFKADLLTGELKLDHTYMKINASGKYVILNLSFEKEKLLTTYQNVLSSEAEMDRLEIENKKKVYSELKWLQTQNGAKAIFDFR